MSETVDHSQGEHRGKTYDVFISYKRLRTFDAMNIVEKALEDKGFEVFTDARLQAGSDWQQQLRDRINECKVTVGLWSKEVEANLPQKSSLN